VEAEFLCPDANHAPTVEEDDAYHNGIKHCFCGEVKALLDCPKGEDADELGGDADDEEVG
jgi:hypothetical protein